MHGAEIPRDLASRSRPPGCSGTQPCKTGGAGSLSFHSKQLTGWSPKPSILKMVDPFAYIDRITPRPETPPYILWSSEEDVDPSKRSNGEGEDRNADVDWITGRPQTPPYLPWKYDEDFDPMYLWQLDVSHAILGSTESSARAPVSALVAEFQKSKVVPGKARRILWRFFAGVEPEDAAEIHFEEGMSVEACRSTRENVE